MEVKPENSYRMAAALAAAKVIDSDGFSSGRMTSIGVRYLSSYEHTHKTGAPRAGRLPGGGDGVGLGRGSEVTEAGGLVNGHPWTARMLTFVLRQLLAVNGK